MLLNEYLMEILTSIFQMRIQSSPLLYSVNYLKVSKSKLFEQVVFELFYFFN